MPEPARPGRAAAAEAGQDLRVPGPGGGGLCGRRRAFRRLCQTHGRTGRHLLQGTYVCFCVLKRTSCGSGSRVLKMNADLKANEAKKNYFSSFQNFLQIYEINSKLSNEKLVTFILKSQKEYFQYYIF